LALIQILKKDVSEILLEGGMDLQKINAVIWSHHHWDHTGDMSKFPTTTELVVGPDMPAKLWPGYPVNKESYLLESDYK
jgi:metal-dependent hydrolase (beta-lactamase superfamily II)